MPSRRRWLQALGLFAAYLASAKLGLSFDALSGVATAIWPPTGIALAALLFGGLGLWPAVTLAALVVNVQAGAPVAAAAGIAVGNTLEAVVGAWLLRRAEVSPALDRVRDAGALIVLAALLSTAISATFGASSLILTGGAAGSFREVWWVWWIGDATGDLVVAPFLLTWLTAPPPGRDRRRLLEAAVVGAFVAGFGLFNFRFGTRAYLLYPPLLLAAMRFGPRGASGTTFLTTAIAIVFTTLGEGPFASGTQRQSLVELQVFVGVLAATTLLLGAAVAERWRAVRLRDDFLSIASHELRTPLTALKLRIEGVVRRLDKGTFDETTASRAAATVEQVQRLERLISDLLDVSRLTAGRLHLEPGDVDLAALIEEVVRDLPAATATELDLERGLYGRWDALRIEQVVTNLLRNAGEHGAPPIQISARRLGAHARLVVSDAGAGVAPEDRRRIFQRFEQGGRGGRGRGLGLGLFIVQQIVDAHGGTIRVEDGRARGAAFVVELPLAPAVEYPPSP